MVRVRIEVHAESTFGLPVSFEGDPPPLGATSVGLVRAVQAMEFVRVCVVERSEVVWSLGGRFDVLSVD